MRPALRLMLFAALTGVALPLAAQSGAIQAGRATRNAAALLSLHADARRGFWLGAGLGAGAGSRRCGICENERDRGTAGYLRGGITLNRKFLLGLEGSGWRRSGAEGRRRILAVTLGTWWYPSEHQGYFLRWGAGVSRWRASQDGAAAVSNALALIVGAGYEVRVNPGLSVVTYLNALGSSKGALGLESKDAVSGGHSPLFQLGVGLTRH